MNDIEKRIADLDLKIMAIKALWWQLSLFVTASHPVFQGTHAQKIRDAVNSFESSKIKP